MMGKLADWILGPRCERCDNRTGSTYHIKWCWIFYCYKQLQKTTQAKNEVTR